jgi:hypothetical protein
MPVFDWRSAMEQITKLAKPDRLTPALDQRLRLAAENCPLKEW